MTDIESREMLEKQVEQARTLLGRICDDFDYLERMWPGVWKTGAGYTLLPRVLELRRFLGRDTAEEL